MKKRKKIILVTFPVTARDVSTIYRHDSHGEHKIDPELSEACAKRANEVYQSILGNKFIFGSSARDDAIRERWGRVGIKLFRKWEERASEAAFYTLEERAETLR